MKRVVGFILALIFCISAFSFSVWADTPNTTYDIVISDNGDGTVTVTATVPEDVYSGKLVISTSSDLTLVPNSLYGCSELKHNCYVNEDYDKNGVTGACVSFAFGNKISSSVDTLCVFTAVYTVAAGAEITAEDVSAPIWNLTDGYSFIGTQKDGAPTISVKQKEYTVKFYDYNNSLIKEEQVVKGNNATAPTAPEKTGHTFIGWDKDFSNVTSDLVVTAQYKPNTYTVTFVASAGGTLVGQTTISAEYGSSVSSLAFPEAKPDEGYKFDAWNYDSNVITSDMTITATFSSALVPPSPTTLGDVNNDGYVDNTDASIILKYDAALIEPDFYIIHAGDVDGDGYIDNTDAARVLKYDAGLIPSV